MEECVCVSESIKEKSKRGRCARKKYGTESERLRELCVIVKERTWDKDSKMCVCGCKREKIRDKARKIDRDRRKWKRKERKEERKNEREKIK